MAYTKLFHSILTSTLWLENDQTRLVWMTMLALADKDGEVQSSIPGLAHLARVPVEAARQAIDTFLSPDPDSRTKDDGGRRIEAIEGGWLLLNHTKYREMDSREEAKAANRARQKRHYDKKHRNANRIPNAPNANQTNADTIVTDTLHIADADADADAETEKRREEPRDDVPKRTHLAHDAVPKRTRRGSSPKLSDEEFLEWLEAQPAYERLNVKLINSKLVAWCEVNSKQPTRRRLINWLNREDQPIDDPPKREQQPQPKTAKLEEIVMGFHEYERLYEPAEEKQKRLSLRAAASSGRDTHPIQLGSGSSDPREPDDELREDVDLPPDEFSSW